MKILCLIAALGSGGAERQLTGLAALLKKDGNDVKVVTYFPKDFYKYVLDDVGVEYEYISDAQSRYRRLPELAKAISRYKPNTVIAYSPAAAEVACVLKRLGMGFKLIVSERNTTQLNSRGERIKFFLYRWADYVVPNSHGQEQFISSYYPQLIGKMKLITNFVDTNHFRPAEKRELHSLCKIICVGRDNPQKNQLRFIDAVKVLADKNVSFKVDWYGSFETDYGRQCKEKISELHLEKWIELKGETRDVRYEYWTHDVFCLPSIYEGFPNVLCEAMSCGLPVVCSNVCDNHLIVENGVNGLLFDPNNIEDMAEKVERMVFMSVEEKEQMSISNRGKSMRLFSEEAFLNKYKEIL